MVDSIESRSSDGYSILSFQLYVPEHYRLAADNNWFHLHSAINRIRRNRKLVIGWSLLKVISAYRIYGKLANERFYPKRHLTRFCIVIRPGIIINFDGVPLQIPFHNDGQDLSLRLYVRNSVHNGNRGLDEYELSCYFDEHIQLCATINVNIYTLLSIDSLRFEAKWFDWPCIMSQRTKSL